MIITKNTTGLIILNILLLLSIGYNYYTRITDDLNIGWYPGGCMRARNYNYQAIAYGDTLDGSILLKYGIVPSNKYEQYKAFHLLLIPYVSVSDMKIMEYMNSYSYIYIDNSILLIILLCKPQNIYVPDEAWTYANTLAHKSRYNYMNIILDKKGGILEQLRIYPCECRYHVIWDKHEIVKWQGREDMSSIEFRKLITDVSGGIR